MIRRLSHQLLSKASNLSLFFTILQYFPRETLQLRERTIFAEQCVNSRKKNLKTCIAPRRITSRSKTSLGKLSHWRYNFETCAIQRNKKEEEKKWNLVRSRAIIVVCRFKNFQIKKCWIEVSLTADIYIPSFCCRIVEVLFRYHNNITHISLQHGRLSTDCFQFESLASSGGDICHHHVDPFTLTPHVVILRNSHCPGKKSSAFPAATTENCRSRISRRWSTRPDNCISILYK